MSNIQMERIPLFTQSKGRGILMDIIGLTELETQKELAKQFGFYENYKHFLDMTYEDDNFRFTECGFDEKKIGSYFNLSSRTYDLDERMTITSECIIKKDLFNFFSNEKDVLVIHEYKQFPFFPENFEPVNFVKKFSKDFYNLALAYGIRIEKKLDNYISQFFFLPFLLNYQDINILLYRKNYFYRINHHLDVFKISIL